MRWFNIIRRRMKTVKCRNWTQKVNFMFKNQLELLLEMGLIIPIRLRNKLKVLNCRYTSWNKRPKRT